MFFCKNVSVDTCCEKNKKSVHTIFCVVFINNFNIYLKATDAVGILVDA